MSLASDMKLFSSLLLVGFVFILFAPVVVLGQTTPPDTSIDDMQNGTMADPPPQPNNTGTPQDEVPPNREVPPEFGETRTPETSSEESDASSASGGGYTFVPLTGLPGVQSVSETNSISNFLNSLYRICIGLAAVLAVIQITRAGMVYMLQDSFTEKKEAKHLIQMSLLGLLLVLTPTIVFSIIDPRILNLDINAGGLAFEKAGPLGPSTQSGSVPVGAFDFAAAANSSAAARNCGVTFNENEAACLDQYPSGDGMRDCLERLSESTLSSEKIECVVLNARSDDPVSGAIFHPGTYVSYGFFQDYTRNGVAVTASNAAQEWLADSCTPPKRAVVINSGAAAFCITPVYTRMVRVTDGNILSAFAGWEFANSEDRRKKESFIKECDERLDPLRGESDVVISNQIPEHNCTTEDLQFIGRTPPRSDQTFHCKTEKYDCSP